MDTPCARETQSFFSRIGYKVEQIHLKDEGYSVWRLTQPDSQGDEIFSSLSDLWKHWIPRGNEHLIDDLDFQSLMAHYQSAEPDGRNEIVAAIEDYSANPFFCSASSSNLVIKLTKDVDVGPSRESILAIRLVYCCNDCVTPLSAQWLGEAALALGVSKS